MNNKYVFLILLILGVIAFMLIPFIFQAYKADATNPCESYCADWNWNHTICEDTDYRLCHHNPSQNVNLNFNNLNSCNNHLGTPHNNQTFDTYGLCPVASPTPTPSPTPTATPTPSPTVTLTPTPTDIPEDEYHTVCREYSCIEVKGEGSNECKVDKDCEPEVTPTLSPTPMPTSEPQRSSGGGGTPGIYSPPVCNGVVLKPADPVGGKSLGNGIVRFEWYPSTDSHDSQTLVYGSTKDNLPYSIFNLPSDTGYYDVNVFDMGHWFFYVTTWRDQCVAHSVIVDP